MCKEIVVKREWTDGCSLNGERWYVFLLAAGLETVQNQRSFYRISNKTCLHINTTQCFICLFTALRSEFSRWNWDSYSCFCFAFNSNTFVWQLKLLFRLQFFHTVLSKRPDFIFDFTFMINCRTKFVCIGWKKNLPLLKLRKILKSLSDYLENAKSKRWKQGKLTF